MKALGVLIGLGIGLVAYLFGGLVGMAVAGFLTFAGALVFGVVEFRRFERAQAIARRPSAS